jgi:hypothetical protein
MRKTFSGKNSCYIAFHGFWQARFLDGGSFLAIFNTAPRQLPPKILLDSKVVKIDSKIMISLR